MSKNADTEAKRCGFVALAGRPNVGKSTLLNRLLGMKVSIVSRKPQTTRNRILGVVTAEHVQTIYVDTPGLHRKQHRALNRSLNRTASSALRDVDITVFVLEALKWTEDDDLVLEKVIAAGLPCIAAVNKIDKVPHKEQLLPYLQTIARKFQFAEIIPVSAQRGQNLETLRGEIEKRLPEADDFYFPIDQVTDRSERFLVAELIREQLLEVLGQEVPYSTAVEIEAFKEDDGVTRISAVIWVERPGQKAIVIGKDGHQLKQIGQRARMEMQQLLGTPVYLETWVKVRAGWADDERAMHSLGYDEN
ncbi:MAG: GTPase Era [Aquisalimonadaceae bacterium]